MLVPHCTISFKCISTKTTLVSIIASSSFNLSNIYEIQWLTTRKYWRRKTGIDMKFYDMTWWQLGRREFSIVWLMVNNFSNNAPLILAEFHPPMVDEELSTALYIERRKNVLWHFDVCNICMPLDESLALADRPARPAAENFWNWPNDCRRMSGRLWRPSR